MKSATARIMELIEDGRTITSQEAAEELDITLKASADAFCSLYKRKKVYIAGWQKYKNLVVRIYQLGYDFDAPRPTAKTQRNNVEKQINIDLLAQGRIPFDPFNPRCDVAASWIKRESCQDMHTH